MDKEKLLLSILKKHGDWMTASVLANKCNVSTRTIRKYVAAANTSKLYILSCEKGYRFNEKLSLEEDKEKTFETRKERVRYIIQRLLHEVDPINILDLSDELYVSSSTLKHDLSEAKDSLNTFDLYLHSKGDFIWCEGNEKNRRSMVSSLLYEESNSQFMNDTLIKKAFPLIPVSAIKEELIAIFHRHQYFTNDYNLSNLLLHLCISIERVQNNCVIQTPYDAMITHTVEYHIAKELANFFKIEHICELNQNEINELALLIISRSSTIDSSKITFQSYASILNDREQHLVEKILQKVNDTYYLDLHNDNFILRFSIHIHNLLIRTQTHYLARNTLTQEMKMNFPFIYDISAFIADMIKEYTGTRINDDEIAYIALHIGSSIDELTNEHNKVNAVILCPKYYDLNIQMLQKLNHFFKDTLLVVQLVTCEENLICLNNYDVLISTYRLQKQPDCPIIIVHPLLTQNDINNIQRFIDEQTNQRKNSIIKEKLTEIFPEALFFCDKAFKNQEEAMFQMCALMEAQGCVDNSFYQEIKDRESVSSTAFDNFAIPHSLKMDAKKTCVFVSIHHKPIPWGEHRVNFVFMISVNHLERKIFKEIFSSLSDILIDPVKMTRLLRIQNYQEFLSQMEKLL